MFKVKGNEFLEEKIYYNKESDYKRGFLFCWIFGGVYKEKEGRVGRYYNFYSVNLVFIFLFFVLISDDLELLCIRYFSVYCIYKKM